MSITSTCLAEIDGKPLPADIAPLLVSAYVDDSQQLPDTFVLRFRDPEPDGAVQVGGQGRLADQGQRAGRRRGPARAADLRRGDRAGGRVRHRRHVHRDPRLRPDAPLLPRPADRQLSADDRLRHRHQDRPAGRPADRRGDLDDDGLRPLQPGRTDRLGGALGPGPGQQSRGRRTRRQVLLLRPGGGQHGPGGRRQRQHRSAGAAARQGPAALPLGAHLGGPGRQGRGPRLGRGDQDRPHGDRGGRRRRGSSCRR